MDESDLKIILLLFINSRLSYREISDYLGLSLNAVYKRVQNLIDLGIIQRFTAKIKPYAVGAIFTFIFGESKAKKIENVLSELGKNENTTHLVQSSRNYMYIGAMLPNVHELGDYTTYISQTAEIQSPVVGLLDGVFYSCPIRYTVPKSRTLNLDKLDISIIRALHNDSRKPISEVADDVSSTPNTVRRRLNRMMEEGIIELSIDFYPEASNDIFSVFQINLKPTADKNKIAERISEQYKPFVFFSWTFSNLPNTILCWVWTNTMKQLNDIIESIKKEDIESLITDIARKAMFFDTWKEDLLYKEKI